MPSDVSILKYSWKNVTKEMWKCRTLSLLVLKLHLDQLPALQMGWFAPFLPYAHSLFPGLCSLLSVGSVCTVLCTGHCAECCSASNFSHWTKRRNTFTFLSVWLDQDDHSAFSFQKTFAFPEATNRDAIYRSLISHIT